MMMRRLFSFVFVFFIFCSNARTSCAQDADQSKQRRALIESATQNTGARKVIELKTLEIRAKIHEPHVFYVLDRAHLEVDYKEQEVKFSPGIYDPITENRF